MRIQVPAGSGYLLPTLPALLPQALLEHFCRQSLHFYYYQRNEPTFTRTNLRFSHAFVHDSVPMLHNENDQFSNAFYVRRI